MVAATPEWLHGEDNNFRIDVWVASRATRTRIMGVHDSRLRIQVAAPPTEGRANAALIRFLAETLAIPRAQVEVVAGVSSKRKSVRIAGVSLHRAVIKLTPASGHA